MLNIIKHKRKKNLTFGQKFFVWVVVLILATFNWSMIKYDPYPYEGPIDSIVYKKMNARKAKQDSTEIYSRKDSSIEYLYCVDTNKQGVYLWLNNKPILLRKFTVRELNGGEMRTDLDKIALSKFKFK